MALNLLRILDCASGPAFVIYKIWTELGLDFFLCRQCLFEIVLKYSSGLPQIPGLFALTFHGLGLKACVNTTTSINF